MNDHALGRLLHAFADFPPGFRTAVQGRVRRALGLSRFAPGADAPSNKSRREIPKGSEALSSERHPLRQGTESVVFEGVCRSPRRLREPPP